MSDGLNWEIKLSPLSNKSSHEIVDLINSLLISDFKDELEDWLNKQVENNNLKSFSKNETYDTSSFKQRKDYSILDLTFNEKYFNENCSDKYDFYKREWIKREFKGQVYLKKFRYTIKVRFDSQIIFKSLDDFNITVPKDWFVKITKFDVKKLKTQMNVRVEFIIGFYYNKKVPKEDLYPNVECEHEFKLLQQGNFFWSLLWECKKCGFICFCSCFKEAIEGCKQGKITTKTKFKNANTGEIEEIIRKEGVPYPNSLMYERSFDLKDLGINTLRDIPYYDHACEICRNKPSTHIYCHKMYARSEFERKYGAYAKKKFFEYKLLDEDVDDEDLERRTNNLTREELGFRKIGERFVSETELYRIIKSIFPNNKVVHHYRAKWLKGQEIDIFVPDFNLAIEYDGIQHFKPIKAWGGEEGLKKNIERDKIKEEKCKENNVTLIRFNYKEKDFLSVNYVKSRLKEYDIIN